MIVIFYRDGVSDGEFQTVEDVEIAALSSEELANYLG
jgi:hypothetical protein